MASRNSSSESRRPSGGGLRNQPADKPAGRSASVGGRATKGMVRNSQNSRSSNSGNQSGKGYSGKSPSR